MGVAIDTIAGALHGADVVVLAVPTPALESTCAALGELERRVVIDPTNPGATPPPDGHASNAAFIATRLKRAKVVKAFNGVGAEVLADAAFTDGSPVLPIAGDDADAVETATRLARDCGFEPITLGGLDAAGLCEAFARTWITIARNGEHGRDFAFGLLVR